MKTVIAFGRRSGLFGGLVVAALVGANALFAGWISI
jgi:hypothetical protein